MLYAAIRYLADFQVRIDWGVDLTQLTSASQLFDKRSQILIHVSPVLSGIR